MVRVKKNYMLITFETTTAAMALESYCLARQLPGRLIPVPQQVSSGCGVAWRVLQEDFPQVEAALQEGKLKIEGIVPIAM